MSIFNTYFHFPGAKKINIALASLSTPKRALVYLFGLVLAGSTISLLLGISNHFLVTIPVKGGMLKEGVIGAPHMVNPILATSDADRDLSTLIFSGLLRANPDGTLQTDLAESYYISEDGKTYTIRLKKDIVWHDGEPITSDDVLFTIEKTQDPLLNSIERANWDNVLLEKIDDRTLKLTLETAHSPFLQNLTMGIIPKHIWQSVDSEFFLLSPFNQQPMGSGPYKLGKIKKDDIGIPKYYTLTANEDFTLGKPFIESVRLYFYANEEEMLDALGSGEIANVNSIPPYIATEIEDRFTILTSPLPRVFGAFFNQDRAKIFENHSVREALNISVNRKGIIDTVLYGYATEIAGPLPLTALGYAQEESVEETPHDKIERARDILEEDDWEYNEEAGVFIKGRDRLEFTISTEDVKDLTDIATELKRTWEEVGAKVTIQVFEKGTLIRSVIRPRRYDILLFGEIIGRDSDPYAFWHSSQRQDPGLNIALYSDPDVDDLLERARAEVDEKKRAELYTSFQTYIYRDIPAVFIYSPEFTYVLQKDIQNITVGPIAAPHERLLDIHNWYLTTTQVWKMFTEK